MTITLNGIDKMLTDPSHSPEQRLQLLKHLVVNADDSNQKVLLDLLDDYSKRKDEATKEALDGQVVERARDLVAMLEAGPVRAAMFLQHVASPLGSRAEVLLSDGSSVHTLIPDAEKVGDLARGDTVLVDGHVQAILARLGDKQQTGEEARLVRRIDEHCVEVELDHGGLHLFYMAAELARGLAAGEVEPGHNVIVCAQRRMAFRGVPPADGLAHYTFLDREPAPKISVEQDIASPSAFIETLSSHLHRELGGAELARMYRLQRCRAVFLTGGTGTGKTLNIQGFLNRMYEITSEHTGISVEDLPPRVLRLRSSQIRSKWYGEAERNIDKFFDEVDALCRERVIDANGNERELPVVVVAEEVDGLTRERGTSHDSTDDRVQTTILQRLDTTSRKLRDSLVIILCTSNVPSLLDPAFVRRAGGIIEHFGRLNRTVFEDVLTRQVRDIPFATEEGARGDKAIANVASWLYGPLADGGVVELVYAGTTQGVVRHRRDFLTGALVERAVQQAAMEACHLHEQGCGEPGLTTELLATAIAEQVHNLVEQLTEHNAHHHLDVPRGSRVASVRPIHQDRILPAELLR